MPEKTVETVETGKLDPFGIINDVGTRNAVKAVVKILVPAAVAYAVAKGWVPENQSEAMTAKAGDWIVHLIEVGIVASAAFSAYRHAHHVEAEVQIARVMPAGTPREEIHTLAKTLDPKDIASMLPPPTPPTR